MTAHFEPAATDPADRNREPATTTGTLCVACESLDQPTGVPWMDAPSIVSNFQPEEYRHERPAH